MPGRGGTAAREAVEWARERGPDLVCITGDLVSRPRGEAELRRLLELLPRCYAILGNHDIGAKRDPFSKPVELTTLDPATLLVDDGRMLDVRGGACVARRPRSGGARHGARPEPGGGALDPPRPLSRPRSSRIPEDSVDLVLAGHMHDGQICVPFPGGKIRLAHPTARFTHGLYRQGRTVMHISPGLGMTFVPFRFFARPEATELVLRAQKSPKKGASAGCLTGGTLTYTRIGGGEPTGLAPDVLGALCGGCGARGGRRRGARARARAPSRRVSACSEENGAFAVEVHLRVAPGVTMPKVGHDVQARVATYLERMTGSPPATVDVVIREIG